MNNPECFIVNFRNRFSAIPAKVVKEGKATISVEVFRNDGTSYIKIFNKRKSYLTGEYDNPRELTTTSFSEIRGQLDERGANSYSYSDILTFDVENVRVRWEKQKMQDNLDKRAQKLKEDIAAFLPPFKEFCNTPENVARLEALEKALTIGEAADSVTP